MLHLSDRFRLLSLAFTAASLVLVSCTPEEDINGSLLMVKKRLSDNNSQNEITYQLTNNSDFPCQITLTETWQDDEYHWYQNYHFDLSDIEKNTFIQSKAGRRAIIYSGYKLAQDGNRKDFTEIRINNIRYRGRMNDEAQNTIMASINKAITLCEEKNNF